MAFCQSCGSPVEGKFCAKCGAAAGSGAGPQHIDATGLTDNVASALCYIPIVGLVFLLIEPYNHNKLIRFHAFQSLFLLGATIVLNIAVESISSIFWSFWGLYALVKVAFFFVWVFLIIKALKGEKIVLPIIGPLAEKQA